MMIMARNKAFLVVVLIALLLPTIVQGVIRRQERNLRQHHDTISNKKHSTKKGSSALDCIPLLSPTPAPIKGNPGLKSTKGSKGSTANPSFSPAPSSNKGKSSSPKGSTSHPTLSAAPSSSTGKGSSSLTNKSGKGGTAAPVSIPKT